MFHLSKVFKEEKPIIGMLHLDDLAGKNFKGVDFVVEKALKDINAFQNGGIDGILVENWKEESVGEFVSAETAKNLTTVCKKLSKFIEVPFGINVLNNDYRVAFLIAKEVEASFVELDVFIDKVKSDFKNNIIAIKKPFVINPNPKVIWEHAKKIGAENIPLFVFVQPKHYKLLEIGKTIEDSAVQAEKAGASALLITKETGIAPTLDLIRRAKSVVQIPVGIGSGFSYENALEYMSVSDFAVVGTSIKKGGDTDNPVDIERVKSLMSLVKELRT